MRNAPEPRSPTSDHSFRNLIGAASVLVLLSGISNEARASTGGSLLPAEGQMTNGCLPSNGGILSEEICTPCPEAKEQAINAAERWVFAHRGRILGAYEKLCKEYPEDINCGPFLEAARKEIFSKAPSVQFYCPAADIQNSHGGYLAGRALKLRAGDSPGEVALFPYLFTYDPKEEQEVCTFISLIVHEKAHTIMNISHSDPKWRDPSPTARGIDPVQHLEERTYNVCRVILR